ncbi:ArsR/SmtB family transcription factor [Roseobacteraceae bacterium S113]
MTNNLNTYFAALADPTRRAVIERLTQGAASVSDLHAPHAMALPTFLKHLNVLETGGLVRSTKKGRVRMVQIEAAPLAELDAWLQSHRTIWERKLDRLDALVHKLEDPGARDS